METFNKILHSYAMYCRKKILKCYLIPKKSYGTLSKGAIFFGQLCIITEFYGTFLLKNFVALDQLQKNIQNRKNILRCKTAKLKNNKFAIILIVTKKIVITRVVIIRIVIIRL